MPFEMRNCEVETGDGAVSFLAAYTVDGGHYIGAEDWAVKLAERGIEPTVRPGQESVCSIGFCEAEQKWYGWSHRAICGFGVGSTVNRGDCAYSPTDPDDFLEDCRRFWHDSDRHEWTTAEHGERDGEKGVIVRWRNNGSAPNTAVHWTEGETFHPYPSQYGRGEWTAETLDDARQMACDYAEGVG